MSKHEIDWAPVFKRASKGEDFGDMTLKAVFSGKTDKFGKPCKGQLTFRMGLGLASEMGWEDGDKLIVCYDKANLLNMFIMKHDNGFQLAMESKSDNVLRFCARADFMPSLPKFKSIDQTYKINKKEKRVYVKLKTELEII